MEGESSSVNDAERPIKKIYIKPIEPPVRYMHWLHVVFTLAKLCWLSSVYVGVLFYFFFILV